jgi:PAS domain S-box-containing protein
MKKISIKEKLILYFVVLSVISITFISLFSIFEAKKGITNRTFSQLILLRDLRREQIFSFFQLRVNELKSLAASRRIMTLDELIDSNNYKENLADILAGDKHLIDLVSDTALCKSLYFISSSGKAVRLKSSGSFMDHDEGRDSLVSDPAFMTKISSGGGQHGEVVFEWLDSRNSSRIFIAAPVIDNIGRYRGYLLTEILPGAIHGIMFTNTPGSGMGKTGEAYLVGSDGLMRSPSRFVPGAVLNVPVKTNGFLRALEGNEGVGIYKDYRGVDILGAYGSLDLGGVRLIILAEIDSEEAMVPLVAIRNEILILSLIIVVVIFSITWFVAYGITRPLVRLRNAANFIALGNYNQQLEIIANDEIGELTAAFNAMSAEINSATKELKEKEESLRHFYEATLDGIVLHDEGKMVLFNSAILRLTGYSEDEFYGFGIRDILRSVKEKHCGESHLNVIYETVLICKNKSNLPVEVQESCVDYAGKNIMASVIRDISSRKKMEAELADERNKRIRAVFDGKDSEQQRLSRELHDGLGQQLVAGKLILESSLYEDGQNLKTRIIEAQRIFDQIISDIRRISHDLSPSILEEFGLKAAMENLCRNLTKTSGLIIDLQIDLDDTESDELTSMYLFRIAQESLNNVQVHSGAAHVRVNFQADSYGMLLEIEDDGCGFDLKKVSGSGGNGLYNIRERVNILKGQLSISSLPGKGTSIRIRIPSDKYISK